MNVFAQIGLGRRVAGGFAIVLVLLIGIAALSLARMHGLSQTLDQVVVRGAERTQALGRLERAANRFMFTLRDMSAAELSAGSAMMADARAKWRDYELALDDVQARLPTGDAEVGPLLDAARARGVAVHELLPAGEKEAQGRGDTAAFFAIRELLTHEHEKWSARQQAWSGSLVELAAWDGRIAMTTSTRSIEDAATAIGFVVAGSLLALAIGSLTAWRITRDLSVGLAEAVRATERMAQHDLSQPIPARRDDELGMLARALETMRIEQRDLACGVRQACADIAHASAEIAQGSQDMSARAEQTASSLQTAVGAIEQLGGSVDQTVHSASSASALAGETQQSATRGGEVVAQAVQTMGELESASRRIADITAIIDGIAFQTNILALNAAVEAARAGEQGRGFAVVAGEVRTLAQRSSTAAREIRQLIDASLDKVAAGSEQVRRAGSATLQIVEAVGRVSAMIAQISGETGQQNQGLSLASHSVTELDQLAQSNAALAQQSAAAAGSLAQQARGLNELVARFRLETSAAPAS
jgi:methyl-accepting chemotaxis protein